jgi:hypothetical protein
MRVSHSEIVARIERGLLGEAPHEVVHPADSRRVLVGLIDLVERKFVLDRRLLLDGVLNKLGLLPAICVLWIFVVRRSLPRPVWPEPADAAARDGKSSRRALLPCAASAPAAA